MIYYWSLSTPCFLWCHILNNKCGTSIQNMNAPIFSFRPVSFGNTTPCQKAAHHVHNCAILPLTDTILLRCVGSYKLPLDSMGLTKVYKFMWVVFSTTISVKYFYWAIGFFLNKYFKFLNVVKASDFSCKKYTYVLRLKSSIKVIKYLLPLFEYGFIGPQISECPNSNAFPALHDFPCEN